jgi:hypothetical protein
VKSSRLKIVPRLSHIWIFQQLKQRDFTHGCGAFPPALQSGADSFVMSASADNGLTADMDFLRLVSRQNTSAAITRGFCLTFLGPNQ